MFAQMILVTQLVTAGQPPASLKLYTRWEQSDRPDLHRERVELGLRVELMPLFSSPPEPPVEEEALSARLSARCARLRAARPHTPLALFERRARLAVLACGRPPC